MPAAARPRLTPGRVYRTKDLHRWGANASRLAGRLVREGGLVRLGHGVFHCPKQSRFGPVPPGDPELMRGFLEDSPFLFTGSDRWNALGLGTTAVFAEQLVYNKKRSGRFRFGNRTYRLRRVRFPRNPAPEWFVVDLLENRDMAGVSLDSLERALARAIGTGRWRPDKLRETAATYGTRRTQAAVNRALEAAGVT